MRAAVDDDMAERPNTEAKPTIDKRVKAWSKMAASICAWKCAWMIACVSTWYMTALLPTGELWTSKYVEQPTRSFIRRDILKKPGVIFMMFTCGAETC